MDDRVAGRPQKKRAARAWECVGATAGIVFAVLLIRSGGVVSLLLGLLMILSCLGAIRKAFT